MRLPGTRQEAPGTGRSLLGNSEILAEGRQGRDRLDGQDTCPSCPSLNHR